MEQPEFKERYFNQSAQLPYGAEPSDIADAIKEFYTFYSELNEFLLNSGFGRIETILRANNALSDFIGNVVTESVADQSDALIHNQKQDGFPDLLPMNNDQYAKEDYEIHHGDEGIETKCSKSNGGWQAHNNEEAWFMCLGTSEETQTRRLNRWLRFNSYKYSRPIWMKTTGVTLDVAKIHAERLPLLSFHQG